MNKCIFINPNSKIIKERDEIFDFYSEKCIEDYNLLLNNNNTTDANIDKAFYHQNIGDGYYVLQKFQLALKEFNKSIELCGGENECKTSIFFRNRGNCFGYLEDNKSAIKDYSKAIELSPTISEFYNNR